MASARPGTGTDSTTQVCTPAPDILVQTLLANDPADILTAAAAARPCHHKLSWASASCCVGSDGGQHVQQQQQQQQQPPSLPACNKLM